MKTKFKVLAGCAVAAIATVATVNVSLSMKSDRQQLSDLQLANVEALAQKNSEGNFDLPGNFNHFTNGSCTITLPNGTKRHGIWYDCNLGNTACVQGCVAN